MTGTARRCAQLMIERRDFVEFSLDDVLSGGCGVVPRGAWVALAAHLGVEVEVSLDDLSVLESVPAGAEVDLADLRARFSATRVDGLLAAGLLLPGGEATSPLARRDAVLRTIPWWAPAAVMQSFGRWRDVDVAAAPPQTIADMVAANGPPPPHVHSRTTAERRHPLPRPIKTALDGLMSRRITCRNFDPSAVLDLPLFSGIMHRVFGAQGQMELAPGAVALKKNSPSGGGLHPIEAYVLVQRVAGVMPGIYHYHPTEHALEPLAVLDPDAAAQLALRLVAGQEWFSPAPVLVLMTARFDRNFWKYRHHGKAWKVIQLDAGHLSQNIYLSAAEHGLGAFVTGAINDVLVEEWLGIDGVSEGVVAISGFGPRSGGRDTLEFEVPG